MTTRPPAPPLALPPAPRPPEPAWEERGIASWYGEPHHGRRTASGEVYDMHQLTAAHRTLPFGTRVLVENLANARTVEVRITDRGPFKDDRVIDLSYAAARALGAIGAGTVPVRLRVVPDPDGRRPEPRSGPLRWTVQLGAFGEEARARAFADSLRDAGVTAAVHRVEATGGAVYRVRTPAFAERASAQAEAERLARAGYAVLVTEE